MTKFKDVAHLYMGCKVEVTSLEDGVKHIDSIEWVSRDSVELKTWGSFHFENDTLASIKPILRPLSDMTDTECKEWFGYEKREKDEWYCELIHQDIGKPNVWFKLLVEHFDLFNLIESGEAIDATTLTDGELESGLSGKL